MVEAAVVFPLVIITVITCVLICMFFYSQTIEQSRLHMAMRQAAGQADGHREYGDVIGGYEDRITTERSGLFYSSRGMESVRMINRGSIRGRVDQRIESIWTASNGVSYVRFCGLASRVAEGSGAKDTR